MPLVRIDLVEGRTDAEVAALADTVQEVLEDVFAAPPRDRYQVISEHRPGRLVLQDTGLGFERTDGVGALVQVVQQGRTTAQKQALYAALAERLEAKAGVAPTDLVVSVTENTRADWSFGLGRAQFVEGDLDAPGRCRGPATLLLHLSRVAPPRPPERVRTAALREHRGAGGASPRAGRGPRGR